MDLCRSVSPGINGELKGHAYVKACGGHGACWVFSFVCSVETSLLSHIATAASYAVLVLKEALPTYTVTSSCHLCQRIV